MTLTTDDRSEIASAWNSRGGSLIKQMLAEQTGESRDELFHIMVKKPETLTGRTAIAKANKISALQDFAESVEDAIRPLTRKGGGQ